MKEIPLTQGKVALVDDEDFEELNKHKWYANRHGLTFYAKYKTLISHCRPRKTIVMHRCLIHIPEGKQIDHIDGNGLNNQKSNLRAVTNRENGQNRHDPNKSSKFPGVSWIKRDQIWRSQIVISGKKIHLGDFFSEDEAYQAYKEANNETPKSKPREHTYRKQESKK